MIKQLFLFVLFTAILSNIGLSQGHMDKSDNYERIRAQKIAYITDALELTPSESEKFWPVYNEFKEQYYALHKERHAIDEIGDISESEAKALLTKSIVRDRKEIELRETYNAKFLEAIPANKLVKLRGIERKFKKEILSSFKNKYRSKKS